LESILGMIVFFAIMFIVGKSAKPAKKAPPQSDPNLKQTDSIPGKPIAVQPMPPRPAAPAPFPPAAATEPQKGLPLSAIEQEIRQAAQAAKLDAQVKLKKAARLKSGESFTDDEGCVGGSMHEHKEEGEHHADHAQHLRERDEALTREAGQSRADDLRNVSVRELRRAVIVSEILDKPVALRRRA